MYATTGDHAGWARALDQAEHLVNGPMPDRPWKGIGAFTPAKALAYRGTGLTRLRRYAEAQRVLAEALGKLDPVQAKHRTTAHIDLAEALALDGRPDEAAAQATAALDLIEVTGHAESLRRAAVVYDMVRPARTAAGRDLGSRLMAVRAGTVA